MYVDGFQIFGLLLIGPLLYALSKIIWANLFFGYRGIARTEEEQVREAERN